MAIKKQTKNIFSDIILDLAKWSWYYSVNEVCKRNKIEARTVKKLKAFVYIVSRKNLYFDWKYMYWKRRGYLILKKKYKNLLNYNLKTVSKLLSTEKLYLLYDLLCEL